MEDLPENIADAPLAETVGAPKPQKKKPRGRPFTPETAAQFQMSATRAKKLRKEARAKMLSALTERLDLGDELYKAMKGQDDKYLNMIERATKLVGLTHDQSNEAVAQKIDVNAKSDVKAKTDSTIRFIIEDAKAESSES